MMVGWLCLRELLGYHFDLENISSVYVTKNMIFGYVGVPEKWLAEPSTMKTSLGYDMEYK